jgi:hypothetical protein
LARVYSAWFEETSVSDITDVASLIDTISVVGDRVVEQHTRRVRSSMPPSAFIPLRHLPSSKLSSVLQGFPASSAT